MKHLHISLLCIASIFLSTASALSNKGLPIPEINRSQILPKGMYQSEVSSGIFGISTYGPALHLFSGSAFKIFPTHAVSNRLQWGYFPLPVNFAYRVSSTDICDSLGNLLIGKPSIVIEGGFLNFWFIPGEGVNTNAGLSVSSKIALSPKVWYKASTGFGGQVLGDSVGRWISGSLLNGLGFQLLPQHTLFIGYSLKGAAVYPNEGRRLRSHSIYHDFPITYTCNVNPYISIQVGSDLYFYDDPSGRGVYFPVSYGMTFQW
jgi:hypothetical protein